jgi:predicted lipoprotein with Yx(FWY)xxD motif
MARVRAKRDLKSSPRGEGAGTSRRLGGHARIAAVAGVCAAGVIALVLVLSLSSQSAKSSAPTIGIAQSSLGRILVNERGLTLYLYTHDKTASSSCFGVCERVWPPATVSGRPTAASEISLPKLTTISRPDGSTQLVYNGHPLYTFSEDTRGGQLGGEGFLGAWYAVSPSGQKVAGSRGEATVPGY